MSPQNANCREASGKPTVWAFDLGKASLGEAVRQGTSFLHHESFLIPAEYADTKPATARRRMMRTHQAHKEREKWLENVWAAAGLEVLRGRQVRKDPATGKWAAQLPGDPRLEQEFAAPGDSACYTSCLLRIHLLRGEKLELWQIYKALRSAIQKRGYGKIPWAAKEAKRTGKSEEDLEKEEQKKDPNYVAAYNRWREFKARVPVRFHFPCYYDAEKMGLWNPATPDTFAPRITHDAASTRNVRFDREDVEAEIKQLANCDPGQLEPLRQAFSRFQHEGWPVNGSKRFAVHAATFGDFLCHGPAGRPFASYSPALQKEMGLHLGSSDDWMGALGQKIPRFDNRILDDCVLIPRFHVCKVDIRQEPKTGKPFPDSLLPAEVTFLMKFKNTLVAADNGQRKLNVDEVRAIFAAVTADAALVKPDAKDWGKKVVASYSLTETDWGKHKAIKKLALRPLPGHAEIRSPKDSGRSGFSRPALRYLKELILSGKSPKVFHEEKIAESRGNTDPKKGLVPADLKFLTDMGEDWDKIYIPEQKLDALAARHTENGCLDVDKAVKDLLGGISDPVVRHRLSVFAGRIRSLRAKFGEPDQVALEFVREDFMGPKRKMELFKFQRDREKARKEAREKVQETGAEERSAPLKYELAKDQGFVCLYCGQPLACTCLQDYEIEHIVPRSQGGPDAMVNYVVAHRQCNETKGEFTPFQWKHGKPGWDGYQTQVNRCATALRNKKVQLLLREDAPELVQRYTALAETAWVSKLAQTIVSLFFGWKNGNDAQGRKRVAIISGGLTARIRRKYRLNSLLNPCPAGENDILWEEQCEKNRADDRHHALDAMVISFIPGWARDQKKQAFFRFPDEVHQNAKEFFGKEIQKVMPTNLCYERAALAETIYGAREVKGEQVIVQRVDLVSLGFKPVAPGKVKFDLPYLAKQIATIRDAHIQKRLRVFHATNPDEAQWRAFCGSFHQGESGKGSLVCQVLTNVGESAEYLDMSKDRTGAYRKALKGHKGQIVYVKTITDKTGKPKRTAHVRPVYAFESADKVRKEIAASMGPQDGIVGFFQSGCLIEIPRMVEHPKAPLMPGKYMLNTIRTDCQVKLTTFDGKTYPDVPFFHLLKLLDAGFGRAGQ